MSEAVVDTVEGRLRGSARDGIASFKGIPFAAAPEGPLRFQAPAPPASWDGVRDALAFGAAPPQLAPAPGAPSLWEPRDGLDCLSLNLWSPSLGAARLPVMVWICGGMWKHGGARMPQYDGTLLARAGVVVVTINYRVGFEGFGHLPGVPDNRGLLDQIAALEWVQRNIAAFGGDSGNVTLFGQSAGAASTALLAAAPATDGLLRRAIGQSIPAAYRSVADGRRAAELIAAAAGVEPTSERFAGLPPEAILAVQDAPLTGPEAGMTAFGPIVDGDLVSGPPWETIAGGDVDLLCGFNHDELRVFAPAANASTIDLARVARSLGLDDAALAAYRSTHSELADADLFVELMSDAIMRMPTTWVAEAHARGRAGRTWLYDLTWRGPTFGACHGIDVPFVFGTGDTPFAARLLGSPPPADFAPLSEQIRAAWTSFAATGDPGWPAFDPDRRTTRIWDSEPVDAPYPLEDSHRVWATPATT